MVLLATSWQAAEARSYDGRDFKDILEAFYRGEKRVYCYPGCGCYRGSGRPDGSLFCNDGEGNCDNSCCGYRCN